MDIKLITGDINKIKADALIVGVFEDVEGSVYEKDLDKALSNSVGDLRKKKEIKGKTSELTVIHSMGRVAAAKVAVLGLGKKNILDANKLRSAVADAIRSLQRKNNLEIALALPDVGLVGKEIGRVTAEAAYLGSYSFRKHLTKESDYGDLKSLDVLSELNLDKDEFGKGVLKGSLVGQAVVLARDMGNEPSNFMTPQDMAETAERVGKESSFKVEVLERREMEKLGMGGLLGVSKASFDKNPPKLIIMRYKGRDDEGWDLALVGKGLTFDTGGISIKPADKMEDMKFDMCGGAATIAAMGAIAKLKYKVNIIAAVPATENMPDGGAYKPGDVLKMFTGKTVEVISTDAEGRLILADALGYINKEKPAAIVRKDGLFETITESGKRIESDLVIIGIGVTPETRLARSAALEIGNGVIVNSYLQTSRPDIYAAGDNAQFPYQALGQAMRVEHWDNALNQGKWAGRNMAGAHEPYSYMPYFFSDLFEFGYEAVGEVDSSLETFADWQKENDTGVVYYLKNSKVRGALMCNVWNQVALARQLIQKAEPMTPAGLQGAIL